MAFDGFLKIGDGKGIMGESPDSELNGQKDGWIDVKSFTWGVENAATTSTGGGLAAGKAKLADLEFKQAIHRGSPVMWAYCCVGKHIPEAKFVARKATGAAKPQQFLEVLFENCMITNVTTSGSGDELPEESVKITYAKCTIKYDLINEKGNKTFKTEGWYDQKQQLSSVK
jgi:type VI secretion system secreted protein Hcp